ncbi:hypothetical protein HK100_002618, partial [Physocladia obscura]
MKNLKVLNLSGNFDIGGTIPPELCILKNLEFLKFNNMGLTGQIPEYIGYLTNLKYFAIEDNHLTGKLPGEFSRCLCLEELRLCNNSLEGTIPDEIFKMSHLKHLFVTGNPLGHLYDKAYCERRIHQNFMAFKRKELEYKNLPTGIYKMLTQLFEPHELKKAMQAQPLFR